MIITFISDTHNDHNKIPPLIGGDLLICAGDISGRGYLHEIEQFQSWLNKQVLYTHKVYIAGNHDFGFIDYPKRIKQLHETFNKIVYLEDEEYLIEDQCEKPIKIWGSPWQPEFYNWAFNLPRGEKIMEKWKKIPLDTDILITHGPPHGVLDRMKGSYNNLGCEMLAKRIIDVKPKIHVFGHIHNSRGYIFKNNTHYINASILDEKYNYEYRPLSVDWNPETNELKFLD